MSCAIAVHGHLVVKAAKLDAPQRHQDTKDHKSANLLVGTEAGLNCLLDAREEGLHLFPLRCRGKLSRLSQGGKRSVEMVARSVNEPQVEVNIRMVRFDPRSHFIMKLRKAKVSGLEVKIRQVEVRLEVTRIMRERAGKPVKGIAHIAGLKLQDPK